MFSGDKTVSPHISPSDAKIAPDFVRLRVTVNESIVVLWLSKQAPAGAQKTSEGASSAVCYLEKAAVLS